LRSRRREALTYSAQTNALTALDPVERVDYHVVAPGAAIYAVTKASG
jgi:hypothetical protein